jgi:hypothetical protein
VDAEAATCPRLGGVGTLHGPVRNRAASIFLCGLPERESLCTEAGSLRWLRSG